MPRPKSFLPQFEIDWAERAHNCQHNNQHRLQKGDKRLKIKEGRSREHFCVACALDAIRRDIARLQELERQLSAD